jgi:hypothetical protein
MKTKREAKKTIKYILDHDMFIKRPLTQATHPDGTQQNRKIIDIIDIRNNAARYGINISHITNNMIGRVLILSGYERISTRTTTLYISPAV